MKNDNSKGRIAATEIYLSKDFKVTFTVEYDGIDTNLYSVNEYLPGSRSSIGKFSSPSMAEAYKKLGEIVSEKIRNGALFEN